MPINIISRLVKKGLSLAVAESCTGGLVCHKITQTPGASETFREGIICYSNESKIKRLGIPAKLLSRYGAVSPQVCKLMVQNVGRQASANIGLAVTGIAGPDGGSSQKPVGLVFIGLYINNKVAIKRFIFKGSRARIKEQAANTALKMLIDNIK